MPKSNEIAIRAHEVKPGDYLLGLGRVQSFTDSGGQVRGALRRITLHSEGNDWRVILSPYAEVVVLREA